MSWIIARERAGEYEQLKFTSVFESRCEFGTEGVPLFFKTKNKAEKRMQEEQDKDPDWEYSLVDYGR